MSYSVAVAPHVTAIFEADFSRIIAHRDANKEALRISVIVTGCFGHHDRFAAPLDAGGLVVL